MFTGKMALFFMPMELDSPKGHVGYGVLFIPWLPEYLHNYISFFPCQHGYIILEWSYLA